MKGDEAQNEAQNEAQKALEDKIAELIRGNDKISKTEMAEKLGISKSTIERTIRSSAAISHIGSSKGGRWVVKGNK
ncbi:MAG: winged helix-turn-helix transcriptional regulator [Bacilli bacterium]|nr:winged helix-turn-helix transcriptional regulator [Bacilli bacterium]